MSSTVIFPSRIFPSKSLVTCSASSSITLGWYCFPVPSNAFVIAALIFPIVNSTTFPSRFTTSYIMNDPPRWP